MSNIEGLKKLAAEAEAMRKNIEAKLEEAEKEPGPDDGHDSPGVQEKGKPVPESEKPLQEGPYVLSKDLLVNIASYLSQRPYREVAGLLIRLQQLPMLDNAPRAEQEEKRTQSPQVRTRPGRIR